MAKPKYTKYTSISHSLWIRNVPRTTIPNNPLIERFMNDQMKFMWVNSSRKCNVPKYQHSVTDDRPDHKFVSINAIHESNPFNIKVQQIALKSQGPYNRIRRQQILYKQIDAKYSSPQDIVPICNMSPKMTINELKQCQQKTTITSLC